MTGHRALSRRGFTALLLLSPLAPTLAGCSADLPSSGTSRGDRAEDETPRSAEATAALTEAVADEQSTVALLAATTARHPSLVDPLRTVTRLHRTRLATLQRLLGPEATPSRAGSTPVVPKRPEAALRRVARAEARSGRAHAERALGVDDAGAACVLGSLAAAGAQLEVVLTGAPAPVPAASLSGTETDPAALVELLQATLAGEHAAVYVYSVLGGRVSTSAAPQAAALLRAGYDLHRGRREELRAALRALDAVPVAPAAGYRVTASGRAAAPLLAQARAVETRAAAVYLALLGGSDPQGPRPWALAALRDAAVRRVDLGGAPQAFPGAPDLTGS